MPALCSFSLPLAHGFHEAAGHGCILREFEDDGNLVLQQRQLFLMKQESLCELFGAQLSVMSASSGTGERPPRGRLASGLVGPLVMLS